MIKITYLVIFFYVYRTNIFGGRVCVSYKTVNYDFDSNGILNNDYNGSTTIFNRGIFTYVLSGVNFIDNTVDDNLVHIYELTAEKITTIYNPTYTVNAHIYRRNIVNQIRVFGEVSNIRIIPEYTIEFIKSRDVTKYNALVNAVKMGTKNVYVVNYNKKFKNNDEEGIGDTAIDELVEVKEENEVTNPNTFDNIYNYVLLILYSLLGLFAIKFIKRRS